MEQTSRSLVGLLSKSISNKGWVCHIVALLFTLKWILRAKEEWWKLKYFTTQKYNVEKIL